MTTNFSLSFETWVQSPRIQLKEILRNISNTRHSVSSHIKHREQTCSGVFLKNFEVFDILRETL